MSDFLSIALNMLRTNVPPFVIEGEWPEDETRAQVEAVMRQHYPHEDYGGGFNFWRIWHSGGAIWAMRFTWTQGTINARTVDGFAERMRAYHLNLT